MAWHSLLCVWYPSLCSSWNSRFLLHTAHYLFLKDLMRTCAIVCMLVQLLPVVPHQPAPPNNLLWIREEPFSMARRVAVQRAWLEYQHHMVRWRKRCWSIQAEFHTNQYAAQGLTWCSSVQCYKEFEAGESKCGTSAGTKKAQEHQKELWTTW